MQAVIDRVRLAVIYLGVALKPDSRNFKLIHKRVIYQLTRINSKSVLPVEFAESIRQKINEFYGTKKRKIIVCGHGDKYI